MLFGYFSSYQTVRDLKEKAQEEIKKLKDY
jgi:hypothetical protein